MVLMNGSNNNAVGFRVFIFKFKHVDDSGTDANLTEWGFWGNSKYHVIPANTYCATGRNGVLSE